MRQNRLLNMVNTGEFFGEMAYIWGDEQPRHATADAMTDLLLCEFDAAKVAQMGLAAQLQLVKALARNVVDRLVRANQRIAAAR